MQKIELYKYTDNNITIITPNKKNKNDTCSLFRLIADDGKILYNNDVYVYAIDTYTCKEWDEIIDPNPQEDIENDEYINNSDSNNYNDNKLINN